MKLLFKDSISKKMLYCIKEKEERPYQGRHSFREVRGIMVT